MALLTLKLSMFVLNYNESMWSSRDNESNFVKCNTGQQSHAPQGIVGVLTSQPHILTAFHAELLEDCARRGGERRG